MGELLDSTISECGTMREDTKDCGTSGVRTPARKSYCHSSRSPQPPLHHVVLRARSYNTLDLPIHRSRSCEGVSLVCNFAVLFTWKSITQRSYLCLVCNASQDFEHHPSQMNPLYASQRSRTTPSEDSDDARIGFENARQNYKNIIGGRTPCLN